MLCILIHVLILTVIRVVLLPLVDMFYNTYILCKCPVCSRHDMAEQLPVWRQILTHSLTQDWYAKTKSRTNRDLARRQAYMEGREDALWRGKEKGLQKSTKEFQGERGDSLSKNGGSIEPELRAKQNTVNVIISRKCHQWMYRNKDRRQVETRSSGWNWIKQHSN